MTKPLFIGMACGIFIGNFGSNKLIFHRTTQDAAIIAVIATMLWALLFGAYLKYFKKD